LLDRLQDGTHRRGRPVNVRKNGNRDSMQRRKFKDKKCFDRELWREKNYVFGFRKIVHSQRNSYIYFEDGGGIFLKNIDWLSPDYTALYPRKFNSAD
jgi:hypothetical protein